MKYCPQCKQKLSIENFSRNKRRHDGRGTYCKKCQSIRMKIYRSKSHVKEQKRQYERNYIQRPDVKRHRQEYALQYYYRITPKEREEKLLAQKGKCAICTKQLPDWTKARIDHDHKTKKVRGILCNDCNLLLGHAFDNIVTLQKAVDYLQQHITL